MRWLVFMLLLLPSLAQATTWYVRPADDGNGTDLTYGASDGTSSATAFDGFADIAGLAAGDIVCLPGSEEPFFEPLNTGTAGVTYRGCGTTMALIWSAQGLSGDRSFNGSLAAVNGASYAWTAMGSDIYKKKIDAIARMLWEDSTWLQPLVLYTDSEATILATLQPGQWTHKDTGDTTGFIYYRATVAGNSPTNTVIRTFYVPAATGTPPAFVTIDVNNITMENIEIRGNTRSAALPYSLLISEASGTTLDTVLFSRNSIGPATSSVTLPVNDTRLLDVSVLYSQGTGLVIQPGVGLNRFTVDGGSYSYSTGLEYGGSAFAAGDGDGIGIGQGGGTGADIVIRHITASGNLNTGVFTGTASAMTITNLSILGAIMIGNTNGCIQEPATAQIVGIYTIAGLLCQGSAGGDTIGRAPILIGQPPSARTVTLANMTFTGNVSYAQIDFQPHANNNMVLRNIVFTANPGSTVDKGDLYFSESSLIGDEIFDHIYFYSRPNTHAKFVQTGSTGHRYYDTAGDFTTWESTAGESGSVINTDPLLTADYKTKATSPLRGTGTAFADCIDARARPCWSPPDIGAYQSTSGDPAATRAVRN